MKEDALVGLSEWTIKVTIRVLIRGGRDDLSSVPRIYMVKGQN